MRLASLEVSQIRNLADQEIALDRQFNLLVGANGQGKSSVLEALYLLGTTRSFRTSRLSELIRFGGGPARVAGSGEAVGETLAVLLGKTEKKFLKYDKQVAAADYVGTLDVVPLSHHLVLGFSRKPGERRRFLDRMALATWPFYLGELAELRRACAQRAEVAAAGIRGPERQAWDARAVAAALPVARRRHEMAGALEAQLRSAARAVFPEGAQVSVRLVGRPTFDPSNETRYSDELLGLFAAQEANPVRRETPAGPLRDDLEIAMGGRDILRFGSAGQVRSLLTAAILGEMRRIEGLKGRFPLLLLDDLDADLDEGRYGALLSELGGGAQVAAATSKPGLAREMARSARCFEVREGVVTTA